MCNAIVWQCRRTAAICDQLKADGWIEAVQEKTGLLIDAYFSGTKLKWLLDNIPGARKRAEQGELCCGTVDSWLIWNLTRGAAHVTDCSNASRTMLFNIHTLQWDQELCGMLGIPLALLPQPRANSEVYGTIASGISGLEDLAGIPICGSAGDQAAALFGQGCFVPGQAKNTYGTGCFTLMNVGTSAVRSRSGLVTSVGWQLNGETTYALEGSVFNAGSAIQWLTSWAFLNPRRSATAWRRAFLLRAACMWCQPSPVWAHLTGICMPGERLWESPGVPPRLILPGQCWTPSPSRWQTWCGP